MRQTRDVGDIFAHPFRVGPSGSVVKVDAASDAGTSQLIAAAALTRLGERKLFPTYGIPDPVFSEVNAIQLAAVLSAYGPQVRLVDVSAKFNDQSEQDVTILYSTDQRSIDA